MHFTKYFAAAVMLAASVAIAAPTPSQSHIVVKKTGADKTSVSVEAVPAGPAGEAFKKILAINLQRSGYFQLVPSGGAIRVTGNAGAAGAQVAVTGKGKKLDHSAPYADDKSARMRARALSDEIVKNFADAKGFATSRIAFIDRKGKDNAEIYSCYPDGYDIRRHTGDQRAAVGPRWAANGKDLYYLGFLKGKPLAYKLDTATGARNCLANFKGSVSGFAPAPDGRRGAIILSHLGNPELFVLDMVAGRLTRLTTTPAGTEASPCWSPDGREIAYVSDTSRHPQIYIVDVATKKTRLVSSGGTENTNPTWSVDGRLAWASKRAGGTCIVATAPGGGNAVAVTKAGSWEHPSWSRDCKHLVAQMGGAIFIVDANPSEADRDAPVQLFRNQGNWMGPDWSR